MKCKLTLQIIQNRIVIITFQWNRELNLQCSEIRGLFLLPIFHIGYQSNCQQRLFHPWANLIWTHFSPNQLKAKIEKKTANLLHELDRHADFK